MKKKQEKHMNLYDVNYWYFARWNEIFLDLDSRRALNRAMHVLRLAMLDRSKRADRKLDVKSLYVYPTRTSGHAHMIIVLREPMSRLERMAWSAWLGNDRLRLAYILRRCANLETDYMGLMLTVHSDLLVTTNPYYRTPDDQCTCDGKHKDEAITKECDAMERLLGDDRYADYFYRTGPVPPARKIRIPWGKISRGQLKEWTNVP